MKKQQILLSTAAVCLASLAAFVTFDRVAAKVTGAPKQSTFTFDLKDKITGNPEKSTFTFELKDKIAGAPMHSTFTFTLAGELKLLQAPIFDFGNRRQAGQRVDLPAAQQLIVRDTSGTQEPWRVTTSFNDHEFEANHLALKLTPKVSVAELSAGASRTLNGGEVNVEQVSTTAQHTTQQNDYVVDYTNNSDNQLIVPNTAKIGDYKTVMNWNLESVP